MFAHTVAGRALELMASSQSIVPTLQIISGPLAGRVFKLDRELTLIGRNPDCDIVLPPKSVSRKHCAVVRRSGGFELKDMGSTRGTFIDSRRLTQPTFLENGNVIHVGDVLLAYCSTIVRIDDSEEQSTVYAAIDLAQQSDRHTPLVKPETKLRALRLIGEELGSTLVLGEVLERIFNSLFEIFPRAERGFVLIKDPVTGNLVPESVRSRIGETGELRISKTILNRVLNNGQAILSKDVLKEFPESESVSDSLIRSLMCAPSWIKIENRWGLSRSTQRTARAGSSKKISTCWRQSQARSASRCSSPSCTGR